MQGVSWRRLLRVCRTVAGGAVLHYRLPVGLGEPMSGFKRRGPDPKSVARLGAYLCLLEPGRDARGS